MRSYQLSFVVIIGLFSIGPLIPGDSGRHLLQLMDRRHDPVALIKKGVAINWAGYAAAGSLDVPVPGSVNSASGDWVVPSVTCGSGETTYSSVWVGIDGYNSATVEQIGTESDCSSGTPNYFAWFETYPQPGYLLNPSIFPVNPDDVITASVVYQGGGNFQLTIDSSNSNWPAGGFSIVKRMNKAQRTTAEWIVEAPGRSTLPLADFGTAAFTNASWNTTAHINSSDYDPITKVGTETAMPSALGGGGSSFNVVWGDSTTSDHSYVSDVTYAFTRRAGGALYVTVSLVDNLDNPIAAASVGATLRNLTNGHSTSLGTASTAADGTATFTIPNPESGTYTTDVTSVTGGPSWDSVSPPNSYTVK